MAESTTAKKKTVKVWFKGTLIARFVTYTGFSVGSVSEEAEIEVSDG